MEIFSFCNVHVVSTSLMLVHSSFYHLLCKEEFWTQRLDNYSYHSSIFPLVVENFSVFHHFFPTAISKCKVMEWETLYSISTNHPQQPHSSQPIKVNIITTEFLLRDVFAMQLIRSRHSQDIIKEFETSYCYPTIDSLPLLWIHSRHSHGFSGGRARKNFVLQQIWTKYNSLMIILFDACNEKNHFETKMTQCSGSIRNAIELSNSIHLPKFVLLVGYHKHDKQCTINWDEIKEYCKQQHWFCIPIHYRANNGNTKTVFDSTVMQQVKVLMHSLLSWTNDPVPVVVKKPISASPISRCTIL